jgi:hypothetical protein
MRYGPWPRRGRLLRHLWFFFLLPARPQSWRTRPCQGGTHCVQWGGRWRPALTWPRRDYLAHLEEEEKRRSNRQPRAAARGRPQRRFPRRQGGHSGEGARDPSLVPGSTQPGSKRPFDLQRSAATGEGCGDTLAPRCPPARARSSSGRSVCRLSPGMPRACDCGPFAPKPGGPDLDAGALRQYIPNACQEGGTTAEDPWQERHSRWHS